LRIAVGGVAVALIACAGQAPLASSPLMPRADGTSTSAKRAAPAVVAAMRTQAEPTPQTPALAPPISVADIGSAGPVQLLATSTSGAWVALCDAEAKTARLVLGSGSGEPIDDVLAQDPAGRYLVVVQAGKTLLVDALVGTRVNLSELGADVRRVRADYAEHRTLSFDARGQYLAYLRQQASGLQIAVRKLEDGTERVIAPGPGEVFRLRLSADARYVVFDALREDTNKNGRLDWPAPEELTRKNACDRPGLPRFRSFAFQARGDALTRGVSWLETGALRDVPDLITPLGSSLLVREADGSLRLERDGKRSPLAPESCAARVMFADADRGLVVGTCAPPPPPRRRRGAPAAPTSSKREVWLFGSGFAKNLQSVLYETSTDRDAAIGARLVPLYAGSDASLLDLERRELLPLTAGSRVITTNATLALIWRESDLYRYDAVTKTEQRLAHGVLKNPDLLQAGSTVLLSPFVVVGCDGPALVSPPRALALSTTGFVLTASPSLSTATLAAGAIQGPLHWVDARLPAPDGPLR
jgi:hypothetical protein